MHTCISSHGLKRSWRSCPRRVNAGNKNTPSTHHPRRLNVTTLMVGLKKKTVTYAKISPKSGEPQRYSWGMQKKQKKPPKKQKQTYQHQPKESHSVSKLRRRIGILVPRSWELLKKKKKKKKKRKYLGGSGAMLPQKILKVETKICAV